MVKLNIIQRNNFNHKMIVYLNRYIMFGLLKLSNFQPKIYRYLHQFHIVND